MVVLLNGNDGDLTDIPMFSILQAMGGHDVTLMVTASKRERGGHRDVLRSKVPSLPVIVWADAAAVDPAGSDRSAPHLIFP